MSTADSTLQNDFTIRISKSLAFEFSRLNVFPELRPINAKRTYGPTHIFKITIVLAEEIYKYSEELYSAIKTQRGLKKSLCALRYQLEASIHQYKTKDLIKDPGFEKAKEMMTVSAALFHEGDCCLYRRDNGSLLEVEVTGEYDWYKAFHKKGNFYDEDGRFDYMYGYLVKAWGVKEFFVLPYMLVDKDLKKTHIRLVSPKQHSDSVNKQYANA